MLYGILGSFSLLIVLLSFWQKWVNVVAIKHVCNETFLSSGLFRQGVQCKDCKFNAHKKCSERVPKDCTGEAPKKGKALIIFFIYLFFYYVCSLLTIVKDVLKKGRKKEKIIMHPLCPDHWEKTDQAVESSSYPAEMHYNLHKRKYCQTYWRQKTMARLLTDYYPCWSKSH